MLAIDILILIGVAAVVAVVAGVAGSGVVGKRLEERRRQRLGQRNAEEERRRMVERCAACGEPVEAAVDLWERGQWWHRHCFREAVE